MDVVGVTAAYLPVMRMCTALSRETIDSAVHTTHHDTLGSAVHTTHHGTLDSAVHTRTTGKYAVVTPTTSMSTDTIEPLL